MKETSVLILGIGNLLWADEGFGVRAVQALHQGYSFPDNVRLMDGGTQGMALLPYVQQADVLIVFDAIDYGLPAGSLKTIVDEAVPAFLSAKKMSLHQTGFQEVLATAELLGHIFSRLLLIGVQPVELEDYGGSLRPQVKAQIQPALELALRYLAHLGIAVAGNMQQAKNNNQQTPLSAECLAIDAYEGQRPGELDACRLGDKRVTDGPGVVFEPKAVLDEQPKLRVNLQLRSQD